VAERRKGEGKGETPPSFKTNPTPTDTAMV